MMQDMEGLRQAIAREAERDRQRILGEARARVEAIRAQAQAEAVDEAARLVEAAEAKAARLRREAVGTAGLDAQALKVRARESVLGLVFDRAADVFETASALPDYAAIVEGLLIDAIAHLGGAALIIHADADAQAILDHDLLERIGLQTGCELLVGQLLLDGTGVVVESSDGHLRYDNTLQTRLTRMRPTLRTPVYRMLVGDGS
ncbi:MAG: hypothetical protein JXC32_00035 [Anaerolineae bacterium]|nr:hypothetical protein [Anaerolineae bacterium]